MTNANADYEQWRRHEGCLALDQSGPRFYAPDPVAYSHNAVVAESFAKLGTLLHAIERQLKEVVEGTWEERELNFRRFTPETFDLATKAAEAIAAFKRQVFVECEKYKEKLNGSGA